jgi:hypothetical protein
VYDHAGDGGQVIDGYAACAAHQSGADEVPESKAG